MERILAELRKLLRGPRPSTGLELLAQTRLSSRVLPALEAESPDERALRLRRVDRSPRRLRLAALFVGHLDALARLKPSAEELGHARALHSNLVGPLPTSTDGELRRFVSRLGVDALEDVLDLQRAELAARRDASGLAHHRALRDRLQRLLAERPCLSVKGLALDGNAVAAILGVPPGPVVGQTLRRLLEAVLEDPSRNSADALALLLKGGG